MRKLLLLLTVACSSCVAIAQNEKQATARFYVQPSLWLAMPGGDFENAAGAGAAVGIQFKEHHRIEAEAGFFSSDIKDSPFGMDFIPTLLSYKYSIPLAKRFSIYAGATAGAIFQKVDLNGYNYGRGETKAAATFGVNGGVCFMLNDHFSLEAGAKVLRLDETKYTSEGTLGLIQAGVVVRF